MLPGIVFLNVPGVDDLVAIFHPLVTDAALRSPAFQAVAFHTLRFRGQGFQPHFEARFSVEFNRLAQAGFTGDESACPFLPAGKMCALLSRDAALGFVLVVHCLFHGVRGAVARGAGSAFSDVTAFLVLRGAGEV